MGVVMAENKNAFREYLTQKGLKSTRQRDIILDEFLKAGSHHLSTEELYLKLRRKHPTIGYATVYRTLKLFAECGIAAECHFSNRETRYEASSGEEHHDHLICTECGAIIEFEDSRIEQLQERVAGEHGFQIVSHRLELFGLCAKCANK
jgi:Fur family ferric uptake transcriptional regulator